MQPDDTEHPDALADARRIDRSGGFPYVGAIGELTEVLDKLFDGPGIPPYLGATREMADVFYPQHFVGDVQIFTRRFWGYEGASVIAAAGLKGQRPALLSIVPLGLPIPESHMLNDVGAEALAIAWASTRCLAM